VRRKNKEVPARAERSACGQTLIEEPFGGSVETFAPFAAKLYERYERICAIYIKNNSIPAGKKQGLCSAPYIGPLFESVGHGYETTDYKKLDSRLGTNADLKNFVAECHNQSIRVILDGVFNHTGRDFFAFRDIRQNREASPFKDWYCNVNF